MQSRHSLDKNKRNKRSQKNKYYRPRPNTLMQIDRFAREILAQHKNAALAAADAQLVRALYQRRYRCMTYNKALLRSEIVKHLHTSPSCGLPTIIMHGILPMPYLVLPFYRSESTDQALVDRAVADHVTILANRKAVLLHLVAEKKSRKSTKL